MSNDLLASLKELLTPDLIGKAAAQVGETEHAVSRALTDVFPLLLASIAERSHDTNFGSLLFNLVRDPANDGGVLADIGSLLGPGASSHPMNALGGKLLAALYGNNLDSLGNALAGHAGVKPATGGSILRFAAPMVLAMLGKAVRSGNLNLASLLSLITGQKNSYTAALPPALSRLQEFLAVPAAATYSPPPAPAPKSSIWRWLLPLLIVLALLWLLSRCMGGKPETTTQMAPPPAAEAVPPPAPMPAPAESPPASLPMADFYFDVDKFELPVAADGSLESVIDYLKANPTAVGVVSGYHDPTGDKAHNEELAKQRAQTVKDAMLAAGVPETQIDMVKPIETTGSGDMAEARRVEVSIRN